MIEIETVAQAIYEAAPAWASRDSQDRVIRYAEWEYLNERVKGLCRDQARAAITAMTMEPGRWWRAVGPDGSVWCESSSESEVRNMARPNDEILQLWRGEVASWRPAEVTA